MSQIKHKILLVEDEPQIKKLLYIVLEDEGYIVDSCDNGRAAIRAGLSGKFDLVLLDLGLPDMDGKKVLKELRSVSSIPIIVCSVRQNDQEIIDSLDIGADDYITKPFNPEVLVARIEAALRRNVVSVQGEEVLRSGSIAMDVLSRIVTIDGTEISLTPKEYSLLKFFLSSRGKVLTHKQILASVWGAANADDVQYLRVYIKQLRDKLEKNPKSPEYIVNVPGVGYKMPVLA